MGGLYMYLLCFVLGIITSVSVEIFIIWQSDYNTFELFQCIFSIITSRNHNHKADKELPNRQISV